MLATQLGSYCPSPCAGMRARPPMAQRPSPFPSDSAWLETESPLPAHPQATCKETGSHRGLLACSFTGRARRAQSTAVSEPQGHSPALLGVEG